MATTALSTDVEVANELKFRLAKIPAVTSALLLAEQSSLTIFVGLDEDEPAARNLVYDVEDELAVKFPDANVDLHVVAIPEGQRLADYVSNSRCVYQRPS